MHITDQYIACGASHMPIPVEMPHHHTLSQYQQVLQDEVKRAVSVHDRIVVVQIATIFPNYKALPPDAWNHGVINTVHTAVAKRVARERKKCSLSRMRTPRPGVSLVWGRFHRSDGRAGYQQYWVLPLATFWALGQNGAVSFQALSSLVEAAWLGVCQIGEGVHCTFQLVAHDYFSMARFGRKQPPLAQAVSFPPVGELSVSFPLR